MAGLQVASLRSVQNATQKQQASFIVHELLERMRSNRTAALVGNYSSGAAISCSASVPMDCSGSSTCSPSQVAAYDLYTLQCGSDGVNVMYSGTKGKLIDGQLSVSCPAGCDNGVRVEMSWHEMMTSENTAVGTTGAASGASNTEVFNLSVDAVI